MRLRVLSMLGQAWRGFWRRWRADQYASLIADIGLTRAEQQAFLALRRRR